MISRIVPCFASSLRYGSTSGTEIYDFVLPLCTDVAQSRCPPDILRPTILPHSALSWSIRSTKVLHVGWVIKSFLHRQASLPWSRTFDPDIIIIIQFAYVRHAPKKRQTKALSCLRMRLTSHGLNDKVRAVHFIHGR